MAQYNNPIKGDWVSSCLEDLKYLNISLSIEEIKLMKKKQFKILLQKSIENKAFQYLLEKQRSKGAEIKYQSLKMAEYLAPNHEKISISDQRYIFKIRNRMIEIENNFPKKYPKNPCVCGEKQTQEHIYSCEYVNQNKSKIEYKRIFEENVNIQKQISEKFKENFEKMRINNPLEPPGRSTVAAMPSCNSNG